MRRAIHGFFEAEAPFVSARLLVPHLKIDALVQFLIDTGASHTVLLDRDRLRLGLDEHRLRRYKRAIIGVGGPVTTFLIPSALLVLGPPAGKPVSMPLPMLVLKHDLHRLSPEDRRRILRMPSLLGRDVLHRFRMTYHFPTRRVTLTK